MKRTDRIGSIIHILCENPNRVYSLNYFCDLFQAARSTVSEDIAAARDILAAMKSGQIETTAGAKGGIRYVPTISDEEARELLENFCHRLQDGSRILAGGYLYTSDLMFDPNFVRGAGKIFAREFRDSGADYVVTLETKGIPVALMTANLLNLPLVVARRESKYSEGTTVSINYVAGSSGRIQKMSLAKRALQHGSTAIIIDDFMRAGGSAKGLRDMLREFDVAVAGIGVVIASELPEKKTVQDYFPLLYLGEVDEDAISIDISLNNEIFDKK